MLKPQAGDVFHIWCAHCVPPKWKYHVIASVQPRLRYFLINSRPAAFQRGNPALMAHQVDLREVDYRFLGHDSVLDCSQLGGGPTASELEDILLKDPRAHLGRIEVSTRRVVRHIVQHSDLLASKEIAAVLAIW